MVAIGKISYPIYLWHWPLLVFARSAVGGEFGPPVRWALIAIAVVTVAGVAYIMSSSRSGSARNSRSGAPLRRGRHRGLGLVGLRDFREEGFFPNATFVRIANEGDIGFREHRRRYIAARSTPCA